MIREGRHVMRYCKSPHHAVVAAALMLCLAFWFSFPTRPADSGRKGLYAGLKTSSAYQTGFEPKLTILRGGGTHLLGSVQPVVCDLRLEVPAGSEPSFLAASIKRDGTSITSLCPELLPQGDGGFLCHCEFTGRLRRGSYTLEAECQDWIRSGRSGSGDVTVRTTAKATVDLIIK
jgi:hypothetical protein